MDIQCLNPQIWQSSEKKYQQEISVLDQDKKLRNININDAPAKLDIEDTNDGKQKVLEAINQSNIQRTQELKDQQIQQFVSLQLKIQFKYLKIWKKCVISEQMQTKNKTYLQKIPRVKTQFLQKIVKKAIHLMFQLYNEQACSQIQKLFQYITTKKYMIQNLLDSLKRRNYQKRLKIKKQSFMGIYQQLCRDIGNSFSYQSIIKLSVQTAFPFWKNKKAIQNFCYEAMVEFLKKIKNTNQLTKIQKIMINQLQNVKFFTLIRILCNLNSKPAHQIVLALYKIQQIKKEMQYLRHSLRCCSKRVAKRRKKQKKKRQEQNSKVKCQVEHIQFNKLSIYDKIAFDHVKIQKQNRIGCYVNDQWIQQLKKFQIEN